VDKFHLDPQATGAMPLSADSIDSPGKTPWDGVALVVILPKATLERARNGHNNSPSVGSQTTCRKHPGPHRPILIVALT
jgi:hypothetical protein